MIRAAQNAPTEPGIYYRGPYSISKTTFHQIKAVLLSYGPLIRMGFGTSFINFKSMDEKAVELLSNMQNLAKASYTLGHDVTERNLKWLYEQDDLPSPDLDESSWLERSWRLIKGEKTLSEMNWDEVFREL